MRISSQVSEDDIVRQQAQQRVNAALQSLAANILRVVRGAGRSWEIPDQAQTLIDALANYQTVSGHPPASDVLEKALSIDQDSEGLAHADDEYRDKLEAQEMIIGGALRIAAARILEQRLQVTAGEKELSDGLRHFDHARDALRKKRQAEQAQRPLRRPPPRRRKQGDKPQD